MEEREDYMARITMTFGNTQMIASKTYFVASKWNTLEKFGATFTYVRMPGDPETEIERELEMAFKDRLNHLDDRIVDAWLLTMSQRNGVIIYTGTLIEKDVPLTALTNEECQ